MTDKLKTVQPTTFPEGLTAHNSGIGLTQLPPGFTKVTPKMAVGHDVQPKANNGSAIAAVGVAMNAGVPGQFQQSTKLDTNWLKSGKYGAK